MRHLGPCSFAGQSTEPVPGRLLRPGAYSEFDDLPDGQVPTQSRPANQLSVLSPQPPVPTDSMHAASLLTPFSLPSLPHALHLKPFPHQDCTNEGAFALAHPVRIQGYPMFPAHALSFMVARA